MHGEIQSINRPSEAHNAKSFQRTAETAYSISSVAETRDRALSFLLGSGFYEVVSCCLPHQWRFYCDTWRNRTANPCALSPRA